MKIIKFLSGLAVCFIVFDSIFVGCTEVKTNTSLKTNLRAQTENKMLPEHPTGKKYKIIY
jgi:hypothetical protein